MIQAVDLRKDYGNVVPIAKMNFTVNKGDVISIIGPSGTGKSTLMRMINMLERPTAGKILVDGEDITAPGYPLDKLRQKVGMVFQSYDLFPHKTILENVLLAPMKVQKRARAEAEKEALELLGRVGLADRKDDYPRQLSGGQKQRVAIVRALIMHPEVLLLDEITAALDPEMVREVLEVVMRLAKAGSTMLIVTHEMAFAKAIATRLLFLENGAIVEESRDPKAFFASPTTERAKAFLQSFEY